MSSQSSTQSPTTAESRITDRPSSLACLQCRRKHQKCNGAQPNCARCVEKKLQCFYVRSRRGGRRKTFTREDDVPARAQGLRSQRNSSAQPEAVGIPITSNDWTDPNRSIPPPSDGLDLGQLPGSYIQELPQPEDQAPGRIPVPSPVSIIVAEASAASLPEGRFIGLYFDHFHKAHPILPPRHVFMNTAAPSYLKAVLEFIGCHYAGSGPRQSFRTRAMVELQRCQDSCLFIVQAKLLFSIALCADGDTEQAHSMLQAAMQVALTIGLNRASLPDSESTQDPIIIESARRTWWELYIADCVSSIFWGTPNVYDEEHGFDVALPCDESIYSRGANVSSGQTLEDLNMRLFATDDISFSSFAYRIEAARLLSRTIGLWRTEALKNDKVQAVDNALSSWIFHVPGNKLSIVDEFGLVDELMLQAHLMVRCALIAVHLPRSHLFQGAIVLDSLSRSQISRQAVSVSTPQIHGYKATEASKDISNLLNICSSVRGYSPITIQCLAWCGVTQLSSYVAHSRTRNCLEQHRERVSLACGLLRVLENVWESPKAINRQLKQAAARTFTSGGYLSTTQATAEEPIVDHSQANPDEYPWLFSLNIQDLGWMSPAPYDF